MWNDRSLTLVTLLLLAFVVLFGILQQANSTVEAYDPASAEDNGFLALFEWVEALGYEINNDPVQLFEIPTGTSMMLMVGPTIRVTDSEWEKIAEWVELGGVLVLADQVGPGVQLYDRNGLSIRPFVLQEQIEIGPETPFLTHPPFRDTIDPGRFVGFSNPAGRFVTHLSFDGEPVLVSTPMGAGHLVFTTEVNLFTNLRLINSDHSPQILLNLLSLIPEGGTIWLNEWHRGVRTSSRTTGPLFGPGDWLRYTSPGRALLYLGVIVCTYLFVNGFHLGRPVPLPSTYKRRGPAEYVTAIANLRRRAGQSGEIQSYYRKLLKRRVGKRYRIDAGLDDSTFIEQLQKIDSDFAQLNQLIELFNILSSRSMSEQALLSASAQVHDLLDSFPE
ncbi:MAG: DUF4350 domain-containing protein [Chloroflexota bacterium]